MLYVNKPSLLLTFADLNAGMPRMKRTSLFSIMLCMFFLTACSSVPQLLWKVDDDKPDYARGSNDNSQATGRAPLDVPPELRQKVEVPMPDKVAINAARGDVKMSKDEKEAIAGKAVSLDTRLYDASAAVVFSAVLDSMTAINLPVQSVDSPSGTITTDWVRPNANTPNAYLGAVSGMFGGGPVVIRYRFIVRIFRTQTGQTELQVRTLGQQIINKHWVNKPLNRKKANDLFSAIEERIGSARTNIDPASIKDAPPVPVSP